MRGGCVAVFERGSCFVNVLWKCDERGHSHENNGCPYYYSGSDPGHWGTPKNGGFFLTNQTNRLWLAKCLLSSLIYVGISSYIPAVQCCSGVGSHFKVIITASSEIEVKSELRHESPFSG